MSTKRPSGRGGDDAHLIRSAPPAPAVPATGPTPRVAPRCGNFVAVRVPFHLRQAGCGPDPDHLRPKPSMTRVPCRLRRTGCSLGPDPRPANRLRLGSPDSPTETVGDSGPAPPPASRLGLGPRSGTGRADPKAEAGVRASRWYEHQEALGRGGWVTPPSTWQTFRPRRPRHRADAASCLVVWIFDRVRPRSPTGKPVVDRSF
jgi:hypothetical protein